MAAASIKSRSIFSNQQADKPKVQLNIRVTVETRDRIERAAQAANQTVTDFTKAAVLARADEVLARKEQIALSDRDFELFVELMNANSDPTPIALEEATQFKRGRMEGSRFEW